MTEEEIVGFAVASGLHTTSIYQKLVVAGQRPAPPTAPRCGRCLVTIAGALRNQHGKPVLELEVDSLMRSGQADEVR